jgi:hypothetical protein
VRSEKLSLPVVHPIVMPDRTGEKVKLVGVFATLLALAGCGQHAVADASVLREPPSPSKAAMATSPHPTRATRTPSAHPTTGPPRRCRADDLVVGFRSEGEGATGHYASLLDFRNVGRTRCFLSGYPSRVTLSEPGHRPVIAKRGGFFDGPLLPSKPMVPGGVTTLVIETDSYCDARPTGPAGPIYHRVTIALGTGVMSTTRRHAPGLDVGCGALATKFGRWL